MAKSKFTPEFKRKALKLFRKGYTDIEVIREMGIAKQTFYCYIKQNSDFSDSVKEAKQQNVKKVENSLFKLCEGFISEKEIVTGRYTEKVTENGEIIKEMKPHTIQKVKEQVPPNITAIKLFLQSQDPENYKDMKEEDNLRAVRFEVEVVYPRVIEGRGLKAIEERRERDS